MSNVKRYLHRNLPVLRKNSSRRGYEWWTHVFTGISKKTGKEKCFFIQYEELNPGLYPDKVVLGQRPDNLLYNVRPSYVLIKTGCWGENAKQINNFYPAKDLVLKRNRLNFQIGSCILTENEISGSVTVDKDEAVRYPECMTDSGTVMWDLKILKKLACSSGSMASWFSKLFHLYDNYWHIQGVKTEYSGSITFAGESFDVVPEKSFGYAGKRWGVRYPNPFIWISSCDLTSQYTGEKLSDACLFITGGSFRFLGRKRTNKLHVYLKTNNAVFEFDSLRLFRRCSASYSFFDEGEVAHWVISAENKKYVLDISVFSKNEELSGLNCEDLDGKKIYEKMKCGGLGNGELKLFKKLNNKGLEVFEDITIGHAYCGFTGK